RDTAGDQRPPQREERGEPPRVVADPGGEVAVSGAPGRQVGPRREDGVEVRGDHDRGDRGGDVVYAIGVHSAAVPRRRGQNIAYLVSPDRRQSDAAAALGEARRALLLRERRRGDPHQLELVGYRDVIGFA